MAAPLRRARRLVACALVLAAAVPLAATIPAAAVTRDGAGASPAARAARWLRSQQQADGGFELAGAAGFETPDVVLALAAAGQHDRSWSVREARDAVLGARTADGRTALDALDDFADDAAAPIDAAQAAKLIVLVTDPLGLDPAAFDPACDGGAGADLVAILGRPDDRGLYGPLEAFNRTLYGARAAAVVDGRVPERTVAAIRRAQQANGGWGYRGDPAGTDVDVDTTAGAVLALVAARVPTSDRALRRALALLAAQRGANGAWAAFDADDPNATAVAVLARSAAAVGGAARSLAWLRAQQRADGHIASPNDSTGVNTSPTSQALQALVRPRLPVRTARLLAACDLAR